MYNHMKNIYLTIIASLILLGSNGQPLFQKYLSIANSGGILYRTIQTGDGGFAAVGQVTDNASFLSDFLAIKTDANGNASWIKQLANANNDDSFTDLIETTGGIAAVGSTMNFTTFISQAVVEKFDATGVKLWCKTYSIGGVSSVARKVQKDDAGNLYVLGTVDMGVTLADYFILKLDANGNILQQTVFGTPGTDFPLSFLRKSSGEFFIGGWADTGAGENINLIKVSSAMTVTWSKLISGSIKYFAYDMKEKSNGNIVMAGRYDDGATSYDVLIIEFNANTGDVVWAKSYSTQDDLAAYAYGLAIKLGDMIAITGVVEDSTRGTLLLGTDATGTFTWSERIGSLTGEYGSGYGIAKTGDAGYIVCGNRGDNNNSIAQLFKLDGSGDGPCNRTLYPFTETVRTLPSQNLTITVNAGSLTAQDITPSQISLTSLEDICSATGIADKYYTNEIGIYPNPSQGKITLSFEKLLPVASIKIFNSQGRELYSIPESVGFLTGYVQINLDLPKGIYLIQVNKGDKQYTRKLIIE